MSLCIASKCNLSKLSLCLACVTESLLSSKKVPSIVLHCAGPLAVAANQNEDVEEPWKTYLHLWHAILQLDPPSTPSSNPTTNPKQSNKSRSQSGKGSRSRLGLHAFASAPEQRAAEQQSVYDALVRAVLDAVRNLDLEYHQAQSHGGIDINGTNKMTSPDSKAALQQVTQS